MSELIENQEHFLEHQDVESENGSDQAVKVKIQQASTEDTLLADSVSDDSYGELESEKEEEEEKEVEYKEDIPAVPDAKDIPAQNHLHDLDVAIEATMVDDVDDDDHVSSLNEQSPRRESIDDLRQWIRKTSSKLKSKRGSFGLTNNGNKAEDTIVTNNSNNNSFRSPSQKSSSDDLVTAEATEAAAVVPPPVEEDPTPKKAVSAGRLVAPAPPPAVTVAPPVPPAPVEPVLKTSATGFITAYKPSWPYKVLVQRNIEKNFEGLVLASLEAFLSEEEFEKIFERSRVRTMTPLFARMTCSTN